MRASRSAQACALSQRLAARQAPRILIRPEPGFYVMRMRSGAPLVPALVYRLCSMYPAADDFHPAASPRMVPASRTDHPDVKPGSTASASTLRECGQRARSVASPEMNLNSALGRCGDGRGEIGHLHHIARPYLLRFAQEAAFRENHRRDPNGSQVDRVVTLAMKAKPSREFAGYCQRHQLDKAALPTRLPSYSTNGRNWLD